MGGDHLCVKTEIPPTVAFDGIADHQNHFCRATAMLANGTKRQLPK